MLHKDCRKCKTSGMILYCSFMLRIITNYVSNSGAMILADSSKLLPFFKPVTRNLLEQEILLIKVFFLERLHASNRGTLVEDEKFPVKQYLSKSSLPSGWKILAQEPTQCTVKGGIPRRNSKQKIERLANPPAPRPQWLNLVKPLLA